MHTLTEGKDTMKTLIISIILALAVLFSDDTPPTCSAPCTYDAATGETHCPCP